MSGQPVQNLSDQIDGPHNQPNQNPEPEADREAPRAISIIELSSTSDDTESCVAYCTQKLESFSNTGPDQTEDSNAFEMVRTSVSEPVVVTPSLNYAGVPKDVDEDTPRATLLDTPMNTFLPSDLVQRQGTKENRSVVTIDTTLLTNSSNLVDDRTPQVGGDSAEPMSREDPINLPQGHPTVTCNIEQISNILWDVK